MRPSHPPISQSVAALFTIDDESYRRHQSNLSANTKITYRYDLPRDGRTYPSRHCEVVQGVIGLDGLRLIAASVNGGRKFQPALVDMTELNQTPDNDDFDPELDHPWHELERFELTLEVANCDLDVGQLVSSFIKAGREGWPVDESELDDTPRDESPSC